MFAIKVLKTSLWMTVLRKHKTYVYAKYIYLTKYLIQIHKEFLQPIHKSKYLIFKMAKEAFQRRYRNSQ